LSGGKIRLFVALAFLSAAVFVRLGFWQLSRLGERRARNALVAARLESAPVDFAALPKDSAQARFRRVRLSGVPDYEHELVYAARTHKGSPGVNLLTPLRMPGSDTAVLLNRGWVYSGDGATIDALKWRDRDTTFVGYVEELPSIAGSSYANRPGVIARLSHGVVAQALPYPVAPVYVIVLSDSAVAADRIARLSAPPLDEGPHFSYALQWFAFATVALVGAGVVVKQSRSSAGAPADGRGLGDADRARR
jgi:surfeit locus 1 family protein